MAEQTKITYIDLVSGTEATEKILVVLNTQKKIHKPTSWIHPLDVVQ